MALIACTFKSARATPKYVAAYSASPGGSWHLEEFQAYDTPWCSQGRSALGVLRTCVEIAMKFTRFQWDKIKRARGRLRCVGCQRLSKIPQARLDAIP